VQQRSGSTGGVGILLNKQAESVLSDVEIISNRIIKATFSSNSLLTAIVAYSPTNCKGNASESSQFYEDINSSIDSTPKHNLLLVLGDFNAKLSPSHVKFSYNKRTNEN